METYLDGRNKVVKKIIKKIVDDWERRRIDTLETVCKIYAKALDWDKNEIIRLASLEAERRSR